MKVNIEELALLTNEASELSLKPTLTKQEEKRFAYLQMAVGLVKQGVSLRDIQTAEINAVEKRNGLPVTRLRNGNTEARAKQLFIKKLFGVKSSHEIRANEAEGSLLSQIGTYTGLGNYVPTEMFSRVYATMAQHDFLYDDESCTVIQNGNAQPITIPTFSDVANVATQVNEAADGTGTQVNLGQPNHVKLGAYSYRTPLHLVTMESFQDVSARQFATFYDMFAQFAGDRMARGIGKDLILGNGSATTLGIIPSLLAAGVSGTVATGSAANTGGAESGVNTIGSADIAALYFSVNAAYRASPKAAFAMSDATLAYLSRIVTKQGLPLVSFIAGTPTIMGKPVRISPSIPALGSDAICVLFGDFSYWITRLVLPTDDDPMTEAPSENNPGARIQVYRETHVEQGLIGLRLFQRASGVLAFNDTNPANSPINFLVNHS